MTKERIFLHSVLGTAFACAATIACPATADTHADTFTGTARIAGQSVQRSNSGNATRMRAKSASVKPVLRHDLGPIVTLFSLPADQAAFDAAIIAAGGTLKASYNWDDDFDYGIVGGSGPITSAGNEFVSPGLLPDNISVDSNLNINGAGGTAGRGDGGNGVVGVGPSAGFNNLMNMVAANYFVDSHDVMFSTSTVAMEFSPVTLLGGNTVDIAVYGTEDDLTPLIIFPALTNFGGERFGIVRTDGGTIGRLNLQDPIGGNSGAEGTQGILSKYDAAAGTCPDSFTLVSGIESSGAFGDTCGSDDVRWTLSSTTFDAVFSPAPINVELVALNLNPGSSLTFTMEGHPMFGGNTAFITVALFNFTTGMFDQSVFAAQPDGPPDVVYSKTVDNTAGDYADVDGTVRARVTGAKTAAGPVRLVIDDMFFD